MGSLLIKKTLEDKNLNLSSVTEQQEKRKNGIHFKRNSVDSLKNTNVIIDFTRPNCTSENQDSATFLVSPVDSVLPASGLADVPASPLRLRLLPVLKSVSYQPWPFSRKRGADIRRFNAGCPHSGQSFNGSSETFCNASSICWQLVQAYS